MVIIVITNQASSFTDIVKAYLFFHGFEGRAELPKPFPKTWLDLFGQHVKWCFWGMLPCKYALTSQTNFDGLEH